MRITLICFLLLSLLSGCEEALPLRDEPEDFLESSLTMGSQTVVFRDSLVTGNGGALRVTVKNRYVEGLQAKARAHAEIEIWLRDQPNRKAMVAATTGDLLFPGIISGGQLTLLPRDSAVFLRQWTHRFSDSTGFWASAQFRRKTDSHGNIYFESDPVALVATGTVQLFENVQPLKLQAQFSVIYQFF